MKFQKKKIRMKFQKKNSNEFSKEKSFYKLVLGQQQCFPKSIPFENIIGTFTRH